MCVVVAGDVLRFAVAGGAVPVLLVLREGLRRRRAGDLPLRLGVARVAIADDGRS